MIVYVDSSVLVRAYLSDEEGHVESVTLLDNRDVALVTGTWTRIEVSGALVRAARAGRIDEVGLLALLDSDLGSDGPVTVVTAPQRQVEDRALELVRTHALRAMDAWHLAVAHLTVMPLLDRGEVAGFASRDEAQGLVAEGLGFQRV